MRSRTQATAAALLAAFSCPAGLAAQDRTDAELGEIFRTQIDSIAEAERDRSLGATRGLVLTNVASPAPDAAVSGAAQPAEGSITAEPVQHWTLPQDQQVNIRVNFGFDSAALAADQQPKLRQLCAVMDEAGVALFRIVGHTDAAGEAAYNQQLSVLRAEEVKRFFIEDCGIEATRLEAIGVGKQFLYDAADPLAAENRRVEFQALS